MQDWILEADIYRLHKQMTKTETVAGRAALKDIMTEKREQLAKLRGYAEPYRGTAYDEPRFRAR